MTAAMQITDTGVAFRFKAKLNQKLEKLRTELLNLAINEETRPIFKCGYYEILKTIVETVDHLNADFIKDQTLKKAWVRNGWLQLRPTIAEKRFARSWANPGLRT